MAGGGRAAGPLAEQRAFAPADRHHLRAARMEGAARRQVERARQLAAHRVAVMYLGSIVELAETERLFTGPAHPYSAALLAAAPELDPDRRSVVDAVRGELPSPIDMPPGCPFHPRCPKVMAICRSERPLLRERIGGPTTACHLYP